LSGFFLGFQEVGQDGAAHGDREHAGVRRTLLVLQSQEQDFFVQPELRPVVHRSSV
jgi:hypothetical protein